MKFSIIRWIPSASVTGVVLILAAQPMAHPAGSFTDLNIEYSELKTALSTASSENILLRETLADNAKALHEARMSLMEVTSEVAVYKTQAMQMKLRMEALGIGAIAGGNPKVEQRLLSAVNQLRSEAAGRARISETLVRLTEAAGLYVKSVTDGSAESRLNLEAEIRNSNSVLLTEAIGPKAHSVDLSLHDGRVVSIKENLSLIVINVGLTSGVKIGMPLRIVRNDQLIGRIRVVDVREKISGAVIQDLVSSKERFKIGDRMIVDAEQ